ncbi:HAD-IIIC family phosphatase [Methylobacterium planeticum]|uniref:HAD-IIIC family phosphatase n=1 Tax=Methylobacterium planeticum TaxID=2615211 RepID=A0A6N6MFH7_9HYPH|nr:HAD-IIIC family phosphatase [Methylobacterium planeticum]KAB1068510.1 HAD-IIIC family phosphatase [Methylobacterium planeticum]
MLPAEAFLFPTDLTVSETPIDRCLLIGSCLSADLVQFLGAHRRGLHVDHMLFNNVSKLPKAPPSPAGSYDFQIVQLPARHILTDGSVRFDALQRGTAADAFLRSAVRHLELMLDCALAYNKERNLLTFVTNFMVPQLPAFAGLENRGTPRDVAYMVRELNRHLDRVVRAYRNVYVIDIEGIASSIGKRYLLNDPFYSFGHGAVWCQDWANFERERIEHVPDITEISPSHRDAFFRSIWSAIEHALRTIRQTDMVKLVIFDLDDTLWRGQIAEHYGDDAPPPYIDGWPIGLSEAVHHLRARGILVAICSKNSESVVRARWDRAAPLNWLSLDDFVSAEINWEPKAENIGKILKRLSLTARNAVFVDDNPVERAAVKAAHPEIRVIGSNPFQTRRVLLAAPETQVARVTGESLNRARMLGKQQEREAERASLSREDFLEGLECRVRFQRVAATADPAFHRCFELLNKTNQFNTTGQRWSPGEIEDFFAEGGAFYAFHVVDKHTEYGLVGVLLVRDATFVQFVMSCRVLGIEIETSAVRHVLNSEAMRGGQRSFTAFVKATDVNLVCRDVYASAGFAPADETGARFSMPWSEPLGTAGHLAIEPHAPGVPVIREARRAQPVQPGATAAPRRMNAFRRLIRWR